MFRNGLFLELFFFKDFMVDGYLRESPTKCTYISETHRPETGNQYCCLCFFLHLYTKHFAFIWLKQFIYTHATYNYILSSNGSTIYIPLKAWVQNITSFTVYVYTSTDIILFLPWQWAKPFFVINCCTQRIYVVKAISRSADLGLWSYI